MNLQSLVVVVLRLMALDFSLRVALQFTPELLKLFRILPRSPGYDLAPALPWILIIGLLVSAVALWVLALPIAQRVTRNVPHDLSLGTLSLVDCYSIAFMAVGLFYIASHLPQVLNWAHYLFTTAASTPGNEWKEGVKGYDISQVFIPFIVGTVMFVNGRKWAVALALRQGAASSPATPVKQEGEADS